MESVTGDGERENISIASRRKTVTDIFMIIGLSILLSYLGYLLNIFQIIISRCIFYFLYNIDKK